MRGDARRCEATAGRHAHARAPSASESRPCCVRKPVTSIRAPADGYPRLAPSLTSPANRERGLSGPPCSRTPREAPRRGHGRFSPNLSLSLPLLFYFLSRTDDTWKVITCTLYMYRYSRAMKKKFIDLTERMNKSPMTHQQLLLSLVHQVPPNCQQRDETTGVLKVLLCEKNE